METKPRPFVPTFTYSAFGTDHLPTITEDLTKQLGEMGVDIISENPQQNDELLNAFLSEQGGNPGGLS